MVQAAVTGRLGGLASWHPDGTISAHPLVRDAFRRLVLDAAGTAAETSLAGLPAGVVTSRADGLRVVEAVELLLDAGQWQAADDLYRKRSGYPAVWQTLPAARLGQRAATAFVATPARCDACAAQLSPRALGFYLNAVGLCAMYAGDLVTRTGIRVPRDPPRPWRPRHAEPGDRLAEPGRVPRTARAAKPGPGCRGRVAHQRPGRPTTGSESAARIVSGVGAGLAGDTTEAERQFTAADQIEVADERMITSRPYRGPGGRSGWPARGGKARRGCADHPQR